MPVQVLCLPEMGGPRARCSQHAMLQLIRDQIPWCKVDGGEEGMPAYPGICTFTERYTWVVEDPFD